MVQDVIGGVSGGAELGGGRCGMNGERKWDEQARGRVLSGIPVDAGRWGRCGKLRVSWNTLAAQCIEGVVMVRRCRVEARRK